MITTTPYETLIESASRLTDMDALARMDEADASAISGLLHRNQLALESARRALGPKCAVPIRYEEAFLSEHFDHFSHLTYLARAFRAEAWLAVSKNDFRAAARIGIDTLELANAVRRGGLVTDLLFSNAISGGAMDRLRKIRTNLDTGTRRLVIADIQRLEAQRESFTDIVVRDRDWKLAVGYEDEPCDFRSQELIDPDECGLSEEAQKVLLQLFQQLADLPEPNQRKMQRDQDFHILALMRMLAVDLALRDCRDTTGSFPRELPALLPEPLAELPLDPYTEKAFLYHRTSETSFDLYSTGPKLTDGGGRFGPWPSVAAGCADLCLDAIDYPADCCNLQHP